jgi:hypothetical protein
VARTLQSHSGIQHRILPRGATYGRRRFPEPRAEPAPPRRLRSCSPIVSEEPDEVPEERWLGTVWPDPAWFRPLVSGRFGFELVPAVEPRLFEEPEAWLPAYEIEAVLWRKTGVPKTRSVFLVAKHRQRKREALGKIWPRIDPLCTKSRHYIRGCPQMFFLSDQPFIRRSLS